MKGVKVDERGLTSRRHGRTRLIFLTSGSAGQDDLVGHGQVEGTFDLLCQRQRGGQNR